jgi:hypothetical protein
MATAHVQAEPAEKGRACLRAENPYRLVSLVEIVKAIKPELLMANSRSLWIRAGIMPPPGHELHDSAVADAISLLESNISLCESLGLQLSAMKARDSLAFLQGFGRFKHPDVGWLERSLQILADTTEQEMSLHRYFEVAPDKARYYVDVEPFGAEVANKFPSTAYDAIEACRCFALGRNTACVFHLMRVLERGLAAFAKRFGVPADHTNWHTIIEGIESAVRNMSKDPVRPSDWKDQQEFFAQAANYLMFVKDAWRNYTAHARGKYTDEEAETILINMRGFMQKLATRLSE